MVERLIIVIVFIFVDGSLYNTQMNTKKTHTNKIIAENRRAFHDYFIEERFEAGMALQGWEVKSLRASKIALAESYVLLKNGEAWLFGAHISPLSTIATY